MKSEHLRDEYLDVSNNIRHFQTVRFAQLTIVMAITAGLLNVLYVKPDALSPFAEASIKVAGVLISILYWRLQERTMLYWYHFVNRAAELEEELGFGQYRHRPPAGILSGSNVMRMFFLVLVLFWTASLVWDM
jgi:membrane associated rhomboid family serine protease